MALRIVAWTVFPLASAYSWWGPGPTWLRIAVLLAGFVASIYLESRLRRSNTAASTPDP